MFNDFHLIAYQFEFEGDFSYDSDDFKNILIYRIRDHGSSYLARCKRLKRSPQIRTAELPEDISYSNTIVEDLVAKEDLVAFKKLLDPTELQIFEKAINPDEEIMEIWKNFYSSNQKIKERVPYKVLGAYFGLSKNSISKIFISIKEKITNYKTQKISNVVTPKVTQLSVVVIASIYGNITTLPL